MLVTAIDLGGTKCSTGVTRDISSETLLESYKCPITQSKAGEAGDFKADFWKLVTNLDELSLTHGRFDRIQLAIAGNLDEQRTTLVGAGNLLHWVGQPFVERLRTRYGCPVLVANDGVALGAATALFEQPLPAFYAVLVWGTGVNVIFVDNRGPKPAPYPGEFGHSPVVFGGTKMRRCKCGQWNCLEAFTGGWAIKDRYDKEAKDLSEDEWEEVLTWMAMGLRSVTTLLRIPHIVVAGGVASNQPARIKQLEAMLANDLRIVDTPTIAPSRFGESAGLAGAIALGNADLL